MNTPILTIKDLSFSYDSFNKVLDKLSLSASCGESIGLIGANGTGKSTFLKLLTGLLETYSGEVTICQSELRKENYAKIRENIGYVFQDSDSQLFMSTVCEDVAFGPKNYGYGREEVSRRVEQALELVHISHLKDKQIYKLSGGEKKLASIATILALSPQILLMDEPTVALDPKNRRNLIHVLNELKPLKIIASHDLDMIWDTCERTVLLDQGKIIKDGKTREILSDQNLLKEHGLELPLQFQRDEADRA